MANHIFARNTQLHDRHDGFVLDEVEREML